MQPKKVLVVEDSKLLHKMYGAILRQTEMLYALNGQEALQLLAQHPDIDLILLDINMPTMNGLEFLKEIRADAAFSQIPVVIISTETDEEDIVRGLQAGATAYIKKPFRDRDILQVIEQL